MKQKVYINNCVFMEAETLPPALQKKTADGIERLCIGVTSALLSQTHATDEDTPLFFGSAYSVLDSLFTFTKVSVERGALQVNPSLFPSTVLNAPACQASISCRLTGPIYNLSNGATSGIDAMGLAWRCIVSGQHPSALVCVAEEASTLACRMDPNLLRSSAGALLLSRSPGPVEIIDYRRGLMDEESQPPKRMGYGCVDPVYDLWHRLYGPAVGMMCFSSTQDGYQASLSVRHPALSA